MTECFQSSYILDIQLFFLFFKWRNGEEKIKVYTRKKKKKKNGKKEEGEIKEPKVIFI